MKRFLLALATVLMTTSCGMYTNLPAQIKVANVKPATLTYGRTDATDSWREITIDQAEATLVGEPGSIGATFETMKVDFIEINGTSTVDKAKLPPMDLRMSVRVESSNFPVDPLTTAVPADQVGKVVNVGKTIVSLPVVTRHVSAYGSSDNVAALTAQVQMFGTDDAGFPIQLTVYVPIVFTGPKSGVKP